MYQTTVYILELKGEKIDIGSVFFECSNNDIKKKSNE
jgi:hypothetical protein